MTARIRHDIGDEHRAETSRDDRTGVIYVRVRRHKRGTPVSFTLAQWLEFTRAVKAGELDWLAEAVTAPPVDRAAGHVLLSEVTSDGMTPEQRTAWERDVPSDCPCDYIWTGIVWTRSSASAACDIHGDMQ